MSRNPSWTDQETLFLLVSIHSARKCCRDCDRGKRHQWPALNPKVYNNGCPTRQDISIAAIEAILFVGLRSASQEAFILAIVNMTKFHEAGSHRPQGEPSNVACLILTFSNSLNIYVYIHSHTLLAALVREMSYCNGKQLMQSIEPLQKNENECGGSGMNGLYVIASTFSSGTEVEDRAERTRQRRGRGMPGKAGLLTWRGCYTMNSELLWLLSQVLYEIKRAKNSHPHQGGAPDVPLQAEEPMAVDCFWGRGSQFS